MKATSDGARAARGFSPHPSSSFGYLLRQTSRQLDRAISEGLATFNLTVSQYHLLRELWDREGQTIRELAYRVNIGEPSTLRTVALLEDRGLVSVRTDRADLRKRRVFLTALGRRLKGPVLAEAERVSALAYRRLRPEDMEAALRVFAAIGSALEDAPRQGDMEGDVSVIRGRRSPAKRGTNGRRTPPS